MTYFFRLHIPTRITERVAFTMRHFEGHTHWTVLQAYQKVNEWNAQIPNHTWKYWI